MNSGNLPKNSADQEMGALDRKVLSLFLVFKKLIPSECVTVIGVRVTLACTMEGIVGYVSAHAVRYSAKANRM
jgi:hypothetical protein